MMDQDVFNFLCSAIQEYNSTHADTVSLLPGLNIPFQIKEGFYSSLVSFHAGASFILSQNYQSEKLAKIAFEDFMNTFMELRNTILSYGEVPPQP